MHRTLKIFPPKIGHGASAQIGMDAPVAVPGRPIHTANRQVATLTGYRVLTYHRPACVAGRRRQVQSGGGP